MIKFKVPGKKKLLVIGGVSLLLAGVGAGSWYFAPKQGYVNYALNLVGMGRGPDSDKPVSVPKSQGDHESDVASAEPKPESFSSQSQLVLAVRAMLNQQTELALGKPGAGARLKASMAAISTMTDKIDVRQLTTQEFDAAAVYVLSGGRPDLLERIATENRLDSERKNLFEGAVSFVRGDLKAAAGKLIGVNAAKFEPVLSARIYMLQAHLNDKAPYAVRSKLLQLAANMTLGTLFEEAATRRLVALAGDNGSLKDFSYWSDRYQRRFPNSPYFVDYWTDVLKTIFAAEPREDKFSSDALHQFMVHLPDDRKLHLVQAIVLRSIKEGFPRLCQFGLDEAALSSGRSAPIVEQLRLYRLACNIGKDPESVGPQLALIDRSKLDQSGIELLDAAILLVKGVLAEGAGPGRPVNTYGPVAGYPGIELVTARAASVAQQLDATNSVLKRAEK